MAGVITEIAIECGVSEQAVRAWCRRNHVAKDAKGSFAISESQKTAIYQHYLGVERKQVSQQAKASCETCETTLIAMLQGELDRKSEQLAVKDKQIEELNARLAEVSSALVTAQQTAAVEREVAELERQRDALKGTVRLLKEADRVNAPLHDIQPEKTLTGAVKGVTVDQVEQLKKMALRSVTDRHKVQELTEENTRLRSQVPSMKKRLEEAQRQQRLEQENRRLRDENYYLQSELQEERSFTERLTDGIGRMLDFLEEHLPERLRPLLEKARELLPDPEIGQQQEQQQHQRGMGGMEL